MKRTREEGYSSVSITTNVQPFLFCQGFRNLLHIEYLTLNMNPKLYLKGQGVLVFQLIFSPLDKRKWGRKCSDSGKSTQSAVFQGHQRPRKRYSHHPTYYIWPYSQYCLISNSIQVLSHFKFF